MPVTIRQCGAVTQDPYRQPRTEPLSAPATPVGYAPQPPPRRRSLKRLAVYLAAAGAVLVAGGVVAVVGLNAGRATTSPTAAATTAGGLEYANSPAPETTWSEQAECDQLVSTLRTTVTIVGYFAAHPDGSGTDLQELAQNMDELQKLAATAPSRDVWHWINDQIDVLSQIQQAMTTGVNTHIDLTGFRASGIKLAQHCRPYAS
jgi:hypothetical protein